MKSRYTGSFEYLEKSNDEVDSMDTLRADIDATALGKDKNAFAFDPAFLNYE